MGIRSFINKVTSGTAALIRAVFYLLVILVLGVVLITSGCDYAERANVRNMVPKALRLDRTLEVEYLSNYDVSFGVGVYALDKRSANAVRSKGVAFFDTVHTGRNDKWRFSAWQTGALKGLCRKDNSVVRYNKFDRFEYLTTGDRVVFTGFTNFGGSVMVFPDDEIVVTCFSG